MIQNQQGVHQQSGYDLHHNTIRAVRDQMRQPQSVLQPTKQDLNRPTVEVQQANVLYWQIQHRGCQESQS